MTYYRSAPWILLVCRYVNKLNNPAYNRPLNVTTCVNSITDTETITTRVLLPGKLDAMKTQTLDITTYRLNQPRGQLSENGF